LLSYVDGRGVCHAAPELMPLDGVQYRYYFKEKDYASRLNREAAAKRFPDKGGKTDEGVEIQ
jgi:hypothetical protein